jgi:ABC-2 type transport system ATP-binding protein
VTDGDRPAGDRPEDGSPALDPDGAARPDGVPRDPARPDAGPADAAPAAAAGAGPDAAPLDAAAPGAPPPSARVESPPVDPATVHPAVVSVVGVSRAFDDRVVVNDLDFTISAGTVVGVIGPSGSGKTTTIRMLTGALRPTTGEIRVLGEQPSRFQRSTRERIGYMPQLFTLYPDLTARENVDFVGSLFGMMWPRRRRRTREVLKLLELWDARDRRASAMSGGMQRRLELACALVHEPALLFLDEPTAGIDPILRVKVWEELHRLRDSGVTILVTTQYVGDAEDCDQVALIAEGRLVAMAGPDELRRLAQGGDAIVVETATMFDGAGIDSVPGVIAVNQRSPREFIATVDDSAIALPAVVEAIKGAGTDVVAAQELRPTFDEVFAILVSRAQAESAREARAQEPAA